LPEQFETRVRATAFAFCTSFGRFVGAGANFLLGAAVLHAHRLGLPVALTAVVFVIGLFVIPLAPETHGEALPSQRSARFRFAGVHEICVDAVHVAPIRCGYGPDLRLIWPMESISDVSGF
jgi:hypothetical protein